MRRHSRSTSLRSWVVSRIVVPSFAVDLLDETPNALLSEYIEADRRLVQVEDARLVQHGRRQVAAHALTQTESWRTGVCMNSSRPSIRGKALEVALVGRTLDPVHFGDQLEGLDQRQIPPELAALAEDDPDVERILLTSASRGSGPRPLYVPDVGTRIPVAA